MQPNLKISLPSGFMFELIHVEGSVFDMGGSDPDAFNREKPVHRVKLADFYIGKYTVSQRFWEEVMNDNPSTFKGKNRPIEFVSWQEVQDFIKTLNSISNKYFRLPTEAEWEYAARGGIFSQGYRYSGSDKLKQVGWYDKNSGGETKNVGLLLANELGIHDMSGNILEWCNDVYDSGYYEECHKNGLVENPQGPPEGPDRVLRGGSYFSNPLRCLSVNRSRFSQGDRSGTIGFRLVLPFQSVG